MHQLDRTTAPERPALRAPSLHPHTRHTLSDGTPVYCIRFGPMPVVELQWIRYAGSGHSPIAGAASMAGQMLTEGTETYSSQALAEALANAGASLTVEVGTEISSLSLSMLASNLRPALAILAEVVGKATLPVADWAVLQKRAIANLTVQANKTSWQARRQFLPSILGDKHPYAHKLEAEDVRALQRDALVNWYEKSFKTAGGFLVVAGQYDEDELLTALEQSLGNLLRGDAQPEAIAFPEMPKPERKLVPISMPGQVQSALRLGHPAPPRLSADYHAMRLVNTLLGGYFGSRLMSNIREEKGYTYGIGSGWVGLRHAGYFVVATEVGNEYVEATLQEVIKEIRRLQNEPVPEDELEAARNYLLGSSLSHLETPMQQANLMKHQLIMGLGQNDLALGFEQIKALTPARIQALAQHYLRPEALTQVVAGSPPAEAIG